MYKLKIISKQMFKLKAVAKFPEVVLADLQDKVVNPTTALQTITADFPYDGLNEVTINAVTSSIDSNIQASNIKSGVNILGVNGNVAELIGEEKTITPTKQTQVVTPDLPKNALTEVTVNPIPSNYNDTSDATALASNIEQGYTAYVASGKVIGTKGSDYTGHADVEGLTALGWDTDDIEFYQIYGVDWNEEDDLLHKVPQNNIDLYTSGTLNINNLSTYKDYIYYLPKFNYSSVTNMNSKFNGFYNLITIPKIDISNSISCASMFYNCYSLKCVPSLNHIKNIYCNNMFYNCYSINYIEDFENSENVTSYYSCFYSCYSLKKSPYFSTSNSTNINSLYAHCYSLISSALIDCAMCTSANGIYYNCYSLRASNLINVSNVTNFGNLYFSCRSLLKTDALIGSNPTSYGNYIFGCTSLLKLDYINASNTNLSGFFDGLYSTKESYIYGLKTSLTLSNLKNLTRESLLYLINNLQTVETSQTLILGPTNLAKLTAEEIAIATNKNWVVN